MQCRTKFSTHERRLIAHPTRVKDLKEEPYSQKEAEAAVGLRTDNTGPSKKNDTVEKAPDHEVEMAT
ncbi:hypothetical protein VDGD_02333 [Verticillium dahliae]|uniref:Uncharacterized protein n=1 Tax=Verticillium dahliae (strain VdLs.17 / ATCC MYA-4575 / FGSC 10137) TaxID=498257 RepID=G2WVJ2_VERDV|nr:uncharacterized protein VDAG_02333 [Verticillium dahliae VdLs.17]EGY20317.1 hypothetical protein VDAG_02333 [Verticillium dahliae VdLs.17]RBQ88716.1 hypothetical protein VDGD_02333 [Verticillium dahliae]